MFKSRLLPPLAAVVLTTLACATLLPTPPPAPTAIRVPTGGTPRRITATPPPTASPAPSAAAPTPTAPPTRTASPARSATRPATATAATTASRTPEAAAGAPGPGPVQIRGRFQVSNDFVIATYMVEHAVALADMHGFVIRDQEWPVPTDAQVLGYMDVDLETSSGSYDLNLPAQPEGTFDDVDNNGRADRGVQIFTVAYWPNLAGGPFSDVADPSFGWPTYLASIQTDSENQDEVIGGKLVIWAPDDEQGFPTGFGADGQLFTADDPTGPLPAGYSVLDLDQQPFAILRQATAEADLYEPKDFAIKDFSDQSYTEAFQSLYDLISKEWAFNGIREKAVDWPGLYAEIAPQVAQAERDEDPAAFWQALFKFAHAIPDGHVGLNGGQYEANAFAAIASAGYGFAIRELDDGRYVVVYLTPGGPAEVAGLEVGATVLQFNGQPLAEALAAVTPFSGPFSQKVFERYQQARYLLRAAEGTEAQVTFRNPGETASRTVELTAEVEQDSFRFTSVYRGYVPPDLPVAFRLLDSGIGYIQIDSYYDDLNLIVRLFERALQTFEAGGVEAIIVDLRYNSGGNPLGLAGYLIDEIIPLGQPWRYSDKTGRFESVGPRDKIRPTGTQYQFDRLGVLVGPGCVSACESEAYGFSQVPGAIVVGFYPSSGVFADVARGQVEMPEGLSLQFSTDRMVKEDGTLFLEGAGVVPSVRVPLTLENNVSEADVVLAAAEAALQEESPAISASQTPTPTMTATPAASGTPTATSRAGTATATAATGTRPATASVTPTGRATATASPSPGAATLKIGTAAEAEAALAAQARFLEDAAQEAYDPDTLSQAGKTYTYTITLRRDEDLIWMNGWCASTPAILEDNYQDIQLAFTIDGEPLDLKTLAIYDGPGGNLFCRMYYTVLSNWPPGETRLENTVRFRSRINDGLADYPAGTHTYVYVVNRR